MTNMTTNIVIVWVIMLENFQKFEILLRTEKIGSTSMSDLFVFSLISKGTFSVTLFGTYFPEAAS